ncbi:MAG: hypothetical protein AB4372_00250 [Xenococcus sp. (in: cyanobacteria)]
MKLEVKNLLIDDKYLIGLMGWTDVIFKGPFEGALKNSENCTVALGCLKTLRKGPRLFKKSFYKDLRYEEQDHYASSRSYPDIPLSSSSLRHLVLEVDKYNITVNNINVLDQLKDVGNPVNFSDREQLLDALKFTRENLALAIKTERILRENPSFRPEKFTNNIAAMKAIEISNQASSYGQYFDEVMQVAVSVQTELKSIFQT